MSGRGSRAAKAQTARGLRGGFAAEHDDGVCELGGREDCFGACEQGDVRGRACAQVRGSRGRGACGIDHMDNVAWQGVDYRRSRSSETVSASLA